MELLKSYRFSKGIIIPLAEDVLLFRFDSKSLIEAEDVQSSRDLRFELIGERPYFPINDMQAGFVNFSGGAKKWVADNHPTSKTRVADVLLVKGWAMRIEARLYLKFFKPINETYIVISQEEALACIETHKKKSA